MTSARRDADGGTDPRRRALAAAGALLALVLAGWGTAAVVIDEAFVEDRLSRSLAGPFGPSRVTVEEVDVLPLRLGVSVASLRIEPEEGPGVEVRVPEARLTGIRPWSLLWGPLVAGELSLVAPRLVSPTDSARRASAGREGADRKATSAEPPTWLVPDRRRAGSTRRAHGAGVRLGRLTVTGATLDLGFRGSGSVAAGVAHDVDLELADLALGRPDAPVPGRALLAALRELRVSLYRGETPDGRGLLELEGLAVDVPGGRAAVDRVHHRTFHRQFVEGDGGRRALDDTTALRAGPVVLEGLRLDTAPRSLPVGARSLLVESLRVAAVEGITGTAPTTPRPPPRTPIQQLRSLAVRMRIDSVTIRDGSIAYRERRPGRREAGEVRFDGLDGSVRPLVLGDPGVRPDTIVATARARVNGEAPLRLTLTFPPEAEGFAFTAEGAVVDLEAASLNSILPVVGVRVTGGRLDSLTVRLRVERGYARGTVVPVYDGLGLEMSEGPGSGGIVGWAKGLLLDLRLNTDNLPSEGDGFQTAEIEQRARPGTTLWEFLWDCVAAGLESVTGT